MMPDSSGIVTSRETMQTIIEKLQNILVAKGLTVATAESCTGGILAKELTSLSGSSATYLGGVASYSNLAKHVFLDVPEAMIIKHGAVSPEVAESMAIGIRNKLEADYGLSITGIAGPLGGTKDKLIGTVWCGLSSNKGHKSKLLSLGIPSNADHSRESIRAAAAVSALRLLLEEIGEN